jgi:hypothetical protein
MFLSFSATLFLTFVAPASAFTSALFQQTPTEQQTFPSKTDGVEIELPDFDELFGRIQQVSPLARVAIEGGEINGKRGFDAIDKTWFPELKWKTIELNKRRVVSQIEKIDNFQGLTAPILRFRSSLEGPCDGEAFANFIMNLEDRKKWDAQIANVYEAYPIHDLDSANIAMGFKYGDCTRLGVGHCLTKASMGIDAREQLTICGINEFPEDSNGSCLIWGTEMEEWHNHLFPPGHRFTRAKSHIFSTTLVPTSDSTFDVEYVLQLDIGGNIPSWLTTPIVTDSVKKLFNCAKDFYLNKDGSLEKFLAEKAQRNDASGYSLLMTP